MAHYEDAIGYFEQQLATLERLSTPTAHLDRGRAFGSLGDCYDALGDPEEAVKCHEQYLAIAAKLKSLRDQERSVKIFLIVYRDKSSLLERTEDWVNHKGHWVICNRL